METIHKSFEFKQNCLIKQKLFALSVKKYKIRVIMTEADLQTHFKHRRINYDSPII